MEQCQAKVVFTTSGCPSVPLALSRLDVPKNGLTKSFPSSLVLDSRLSHTRLPVFRGSLNGSRVVVKMAEGDLLDDLWHEIKVYRALQPIQGSVIPTCCGVFSGGGALFLVMEDVGPLGTSLTKLDLDLR